ncbi:MAG: hypothetical protein GX804_07615 [Lentisphaerae bacterium]|jgi:phage gpG-like protein|nr:hypothetical protein [Lentisphaerota bacterium]
MHIEIRIDDAEIKSLIGHIENLDLSSLSATAAGHVATLGTRAFRDESLRPEPWAPLSESYEKRLKAAWGSKHKKKRNPPAFEHQLLIDTGLLRRSIRAFEIGEKTTDGGYVASVASDREYAAYHQFGTVKMPARPFLPIKVDFATRTMTLTDFAWESLKPLLIRNLKQIISNEQ